ncbi:hypothetical protein BG015_002069 [Linnemannia schmuckeri]|uniref:Uncharacterized protein n=1 Tax=Linnemannia schmuckeri TaxID=64567 RepID=A0A9P5RPG0_9FUNG|nr:hypothetical protein BG015_002069 [Linnemannia schmuckeri]
MSTPDTNRDRKLFTLRLDPQLLLDLPPIPTQTAYEVEFAWRAERVVELTNQQPIAHEHGWDARHFLDEFGGLVVYSSSLTTVPKPQIDLHYPPPPLSTLSEFLCRSILETGFLTEQPSPYHFALEMEYLEHFKIAIPAKSVQILRSLSKELNIAIYVFSSRMSTLVYKPSNPRVTIEIFHFQDEQERTGQFNPLVCTRRSPKDPFSLPLLAPCRVTGLQLPTAALKNKDKMTLPKTIAKPIPSLNGALCREVLMHTAAYIQGRIDADFKKSIDGRENFGKRTKATVLVANKKSLWKKLDVCQRLPSNILVDTTKLGLARFSFEPNHLKSYWDKDYKVMEGVKGTEDMEGTEGTPAQERGATDLREDNSSAACNTDDLGDDETSDPENDGADDPDDSDSDDTGAAIEDPGKYTRFASFTTTLTKIIHPELEN